jgi:hypothetical protein
LSVLMKIARKSANKALGKAGLNRVLMKKLT